MSLTQIEKENKEEARNEPLVLDSGASATHLPLAQDSGPPYHRRSQGNSEVWIAEFKNEFERLISAGALVRQIRPETRTRLTATGTLVRHKEHLAYRFTTYPRYTTQVRTERNPRQTCITTADNNIHTVDISNFYLQIPVRAAQQRRPTDYTFCHTHRNEGRSHHDNQYRNESVRRHTR